MEITFPQRKARRPDSDLIFFSLSFPTPSGILTRIAAPHAHQHPPTTSVQHPRVAPGPSARSHSSRHSPWKPRHSDTLSRLSDFCSVVRASRHLCFGAALLQPTQRERSCGLRLVAPSQQSPPHKRPSARPAGVRKWSGAAGKAKPNEANDNASDRCRGQHQQQKRGREKKKAAGLLNQHVFLLSPADLISAQSTRQRRTPRTSVDGTGPRTNRDGIDPRLAPRHWPSRLAGF
jgi:hypothetical protein